MLVIKRFLQVVLLVLTLVVGVSAGAMIVSQTPWFRDWLRGFIVRQADQYLNGRLTIGRLGGNIFFGIELEDVAVTMNGEPVITIKEAGIAYSVLQLLTKNLVITSVRLDRPVIHMKREGGTWDLSDLIKAQTTESKRQGPGLPLTANNIVINGGSFVFADRPVGTSGVEVPREFNRLDAQMSFAYEPVHYTVDISKISFRGQAPRFELNAFSGKIAVQGGNLRLQQVAVRTAASDVKVDGTVFNYTTSPSLDVHVTSDKVDLDELANLLPGLRHVNLKPALDVTAKGPLANLALNLDVRARAGEMSGQVVLDVASRDRRIAGTVHMRNIDVGDIIRRPEDRSNITGVTRFDLLLLNGETATLPIRATYSLQAQIATALGYNARDVNAKGRIEDGRIGIDATALAYGARASALGSITLPRGRSPLAYDLRGTVTGADLRQLPRNLKVPRPESRLNLDYHVIGSGPDITGDASLRTSTLSAATIGNGTKATFRYGRGELAYSANGNVARLDLERIGRQFKIPALASPRFASDINGQFDVSGSGTSVAEMLLNAKATLSNSRVMGMTLPQVSLDTRLANGTLQVASRGQFHDFDPSIATGDTNVKGKLVGNFDLNVGLANLGTPAPTAGTGHDAGAGTADLAGTGLQPGARTSILDNLSLSGRLNLSASTIAGVQIDQAAFNGEYAQRSGTIRQLTVTGPDALLKASGPISFTDRGQSNLAYELQTATLDRIGKLVNQPLQGGATLNGRLTGNASTLRATGTLKASNFAYGGFQALEVTSDYRVDVPGMDAARAAVEATTNATFVQAGGQQVNRVVATTTYGNQNLDFDTTLEQPTRSLKAAGNVLLHPQHQEIHLRSFGLRAGAVSWQLASGAQPVVQYGGDAITVRDVRLVSGNEAMQVDGTIGPQASHLQARLSNFNLANVDALMLTNRQLGGTLNAEATITGPRTALNIAGDFAVSPGSFRQFKYQSAAGKVNYAHERIDLDVRLQENPQAWVEANGTLPIAIFSSSPTGAAGGQPVNLRVQSSLLDLGLIQGFTTAVDRVTGTAQAKLAVTGTAATPATNGSIDIHGGAFKVVPTNVSYRDLNAHIVVEPDRVSVQRTSLSDEHGNYLTISGDLAMREGQLGDVNVKLQGSGFEVVHNEFGRIRFNSDVAVGGEIRAPRITGRLGINTGTINIDKVLEKATSSAYSTTSEAVPVSEGGQPASVPVGQPVNQPAREMESARAAAKPGPPSAQPSNAAPPVPAPAGPPANPFDAAVIDVQFTVPDDLVVKGNDIRVGQSSMGLGNVNLTIGGNVRVRKDSGGAIRLVGQVQTIRGTYDFQGRRFDIQRGGSLRFEGFQPPNPALDITGTRLINGVETRVHVGGSVRRPDLTLTSNPPLDQADILSLIIFGQPSNQLGEGQQVSLAQRASAIASGFVASKLAQSIGSALNLDTFEIQTSNEAGQTGATVTVGEQVGQRLYVKLRQGVGADNGSEFVVDYQLTNFLRFESTMTQGGTPTRSIMQRVQQSGADLIFTFSF